MSSFFGRIRNFLRDQNPVIQVFFIFAAMLLTIGITILIIFSFQIVTTFKFGPNNAEDLSVSGQIGDYIGGVVGTLFTFSGTILFIIALYFQYRELQESNRNNRMQFMQQQVLNFTNQRYIFIQNMEYETRDY